MSIDDAINYPETGDYHAEREIKRAHYGKEDQAFVDGVEVRAPKIEHDAPLWVKGEGLDVREVAYRIQQDGALAHQSGWFWEYANGVFVPGDEKHSIISNRVARLLGGRYRTTQVSSVAGMLLSMDIPRITGELMWGCVNFTNGMLSTADCQLYPHAPSYLSTCQYLVDWKDIETPYFDEWVAQVNEPDAVEYFLQVFGYLLIPGNDRQTAVFVKGNGANGKTTWFHMLDNIVGKKNISHVSLQSMAKEQFAGSELFGKVLNIVGDMGSSYIEDTAFFKSITGQDEVRVDRKYAQPFSFTPYCTPVFSGNLIPPSNDPTHGYKRRWTHISFPNQFEVNPDYELRFDAEMPGIAYKCIMAYLNLKGQDFTVPESAKVLKKEFDMKSDHMMKFVEDSYDFEPKSHEPRPTVYRVYKSWCEEEGIKNPMTKSNFFARLLSDPRVTQVTVKGIPGFKGIKRVSLNDTVTSIQSGQTINYLDD